MYVQTVFTLLIFFILIKSYLFVLSVTTISFNILFPELKIIYILQLNTYSYISLEVYTVYGQIEKTKVVDK